MVDPQPQRPTSPALDWERSRWKPSAGELADWERRERETTTIGWRDLWLPGLIAAGLGWGLVEFDRAVVPSLGEPSWLRWLRQAALHPVRSGIALGLGLLAFRPRRLRIEGLPEEADFTKPLGPSGLESRAARHEENRPGSHRMGGLPIGRPGEGFSTASPPAKNSPGEALPLRTRP